MSICLYVNNNLSKDDEKKFIRVTWENQQFVRFCFLKDKHKKMHMLTWVDFAKSYSFWKVEHPVPPSTVFGKEKVEVSPEMITI